MDSISRKNQTLKESFTQSLQVLQKMVHSPLVWEQMIQVSEIIKKAYLNRGALFVAGNGGSAADAQHLVAELVSKLCSDRTPIRAFALTVDTSILTAVGNDYGYEYSFSRQIDALIQPNDIFLGITTSGNSKIFLELLKNAKTKESLVSLCLV
jgi:D-sedoheptulose 7-phosphate isomerase